MLSAAALILQATPVLAGPHEGGEGRKGEMFKKHDLNGDGKITESEFLEHAKKKFSERDKNNDGAITEDEAKAAYEAKRSEMKEKRENWKEKRETRKSEKQSETSAE